MAIPDDVDDRNMVKASGVVELPPHVHWSEPRLRFNLDDRRERALAYELLLTEGTDDDVRQFVRLDELVELWHELVLPRRVREAWARWLRTARGIRVEC